MIVILLGPPGVGKGTQGKLLCDAEGYEHVSTGDLLRSARREGTPLGLEAKGFMDRGELVPDEIIVGMVREKLLAMDDGHNVVFDGFPRTVPQAEALARTLHDVGRKVTKVIVLNADDPILVRRLSGRRSCPECGSVYNVYTSPPAVDGICDKCGAELVHRKDDDPATVQNRLDVYRKQTAPLISYYESKPTVPVVEVNGAQDVEDVQTAMRAALQGSA